MGEDGKPDRAKAAKGPYVPAYLYFADVDDDGDPDALYGVHSWWEALDGRRAGGPSPSATRASAARSS